ncbi:MAG: recombinase family protein [Egibacteraceae bacterium]
MPLVSLILDLYARQRLGSQAIATHLNEHGHRTRTGRPWSYSAVLTVLRNRVYLGEVFFSDAHHPAPPTPLIDPDLFDTAQRLMAERGEDAAKRAGNSSGYLLTDVLVCTRCGKRFVGTAANGNRYRYLLAFETGDLPQAQCGERIRTLGVKIADLRDRRAELADALQDQQVRAPTPELLAKVRARVKRTIDGGPNPGRKPVIEELVHQVRVAARDDIEPWFRVPSDSPETEVRMHIGSVGPTGFEPVTSRV